MTDIAAADTQSPSSTDAPPRLVKMRGFGIGERSTLPISITTRVVIVAAWWGVSSSGE